MTKSRSKSTPRTSPSRTVLLAPAHETQTLTRQRDDLRIRIQHLLHLLHDSQVAQEEQTREIAVLRHALGTDNVADQRVCFLFI